VEGAVECDHVLPAGGGAGELERALDRLGAGVGQEDPDRAGHWRGGGQRLRHLRIDRQVEVAGRVVQQRPGLAADGLDHAGMGVTGRADRDAGVEVEEQVAVDVFEDRAGAPAWHQRVGARQRPAGDAPVPVEDHAGLGAWQLGADLRHWPDRVQPRVIRHLIHRGGKPRLPRDVVAGVDHATTVWDCSRMNCCT
jgi:hypothetical protein